MSDHLDHWRIQPGKRPKLSSIKADGTPGAPGDKAETVAETAKLIERLADLQVRLWAEQKQSLLLVLQALDAGGKDGTIRRVFTGVNPQGVTVTSFKQPTPEELRHDFLWRVHQRVPGAGEIGVFNRSHYEDVLVVRVDEIVPKSVWKKRYGQIREFEELLVENRTRLVKIHLHISKEEQRERFQDRIDDPAKNWKFSHGDLAVREKWDDYRDAYEDAIEETGTEESPWFVVPADRKWYRDWAVIQILLDTLEDMDPQFPEQTEDLSGIVIT